MRVRGCLHEKTHTGTSFIPGRLFDLHCVYMITGSFHISLFEGTLHVDKIHVWFKIANITHALPVPVYQQTDFTPKQVVVSCLHNTLARFHTGMKFSPWYKNRSEFTLGWLAPAWHFVVVSCKQIKSPEREPEWTCFGAKVAPVSCKHSLTCFNPLWVSGFMAGGKCPNWTLFT